MPDTMKKYSLQAAAVCGLLWALSFPLFPEGVNAGLITVSPNWGVAGDYGTWTVTLRVGRVGIRQGGGIRVQLPDSWHAGDRNSANRLQATDPKTDHYVAAYCNRADVQLQTRVESESNAYLVKSRRSGLDGRRERYVFVVRVEVVQGRLQEGDQLQVRYGDTSGGSRGMRAAIISTRPEPILVAVDTDGSGSFVLQSERPMLEAKAGPAHELMLVGPSVLTVGQTAELKLSVTDKHANPADSFRGKVQLRLREGEADLPAEVKFPVDRGWLRVPFTPSAAGILRVEASALGGVLYAVGNPMKVTDTEPEYRIYWGDIHSHTRYSWDGVGESNFEYARNITALDFYSMTDHSSVPAEGYTTGLDSSVWSEYTARTEQHNSPGEFVTLHGYEASFGAPYGHHNVIFRGRPGPLLAPQEVTLPELWKALTAGEALTIPHHTGKFPRPVLWDPHNPDFRRNVEIYSAHGQSELRDPSHPLAFEKSDFTSPSTSAPGKQYAQDAWIHGLELSTVASSDDHRAHPGQPHWGLTAVSASGLTREEVFDALYQRRTYGTTGARIFLSFRINGKMMGQRVKANGSPQLSIEAHGTDAFERIEVLRFCQADGVFRVIFSLTPNTSDLLWTSRDENFHEDSIYYVRLLQRGLVRGRVAMAWSSPIWVYTDGSADKN